MHRLAAKDDYDAGETGECDRNLRRCAESFTRFQKKPSCSVQCGMMRQGTLPRFEIARVLVRLDHVASGIANANHGVV